MKKIIAIAVVAALSMTNVAHAAKKKVAPLFDMTQEKIENVDKTYQCWSATKSTYNDGIESKQRDASLYEDAELHLKSNNDGTITTTLRSEYYAHRHVMKFVGKDEFSDLKAPFFEYDAETKSKYTGNTTGFVSIMAAGDRVIWQKFERDEIIRIWCK